MKNDMKIMLSSLLQGDDTTRRVITQLLTANIPTCDIVVLHPGWELTTRQQDIAPARSVVDEEATTGQQQGLSAVSAAASSGVRGGMVGWLLGFGILSLPGAMLGGTLGAVAGATIGISEHHSLTKHFPAVVRHHYANSIVDDHVAILIQVSDFKKYQAVLEIFLDNGCQHILTSDNQLPQVELQQLAAITHNPIA